MLSVPPLILKRIGEDDYAVIADNRTAGRIMLKPLSSGAVWFWTMTGPHLPDHLRPSNGEADSMEAAKAAFRRKWDGIHEWSAREGKAVYWVGDPPPN